MERIVTHHGRSADIEDRWGGFYRIVPCSSYTVGTKAQVSVVSELVVPHFQDDFLQHRLTCRDPQSSE
ncbi:hypothetical protein LQW54_004170 [Pestalotiopsis sp. IQ-011]